MKDKAVTYKIAMWAIVVLCAILIVTGIAAWFITGGGFVAKLILSGLSIAPGVIFGAMALHELFGW